MSRKKRDKEPEGLPLDLRVRKTVNPVTKIFEEIPELSPVWIEDVQFVPYSPPPVQPSSASPLDHGGMEQWIERMSFISEDLKWLLNLPHNKFWCQVIFDESLQQCLDSYLKCAPRNFDALSVLPSEAASLHEGIHKRVFMTYLRMSTHKESKESFFTQSTFGDILYENFLFDIPKMMDICVLYGGESSANTPLLRKMLENIFSKQPKYYGDLNGTIPTIFETLDDILSKCGIKPKTEDPSNLPQKLTDSKTEQTSSMTVLELEDIILYLNDTIKTLMAFVETCPLVCESFQRQGFVQRIAIFYELFTPYFRQQLSGAELQMLKDKWKCFKVALIRLCRVVLHTCCIAPLLERESSRNDDQVQTCVEDYLQVLTSILSEKRFLSSYDSRFSIREDLNRIQQLTAGVDETRMDYILDAVDSARKAFPRHFSKRKNTDENGSTIGPGTSVVDTPVNGRADEWTEEHVANVNGFVEDKNEGATSKTVSDVELFSMVTHVQDLLPGLGDGFVIMCLEELNFDVEQVINVLLEDNLPPSLQDADRSLSKEALMRNKKKPSTTILKERHSVYDKDEFDVFSGSKVDVAKVHKGKRRDRTNLQTLLSDKSDMTESVKERYSSYDVFNEHRRMVNLYDDEYDDTYDSQNVGAQDADSADELTVRRPFTIPRVLGGSPVPSDEEEDSEEEGPSEEGKAKEGEQEIDKALVNRRNRGPRGPKKGEKDGDGAKEGQKGGPKGRGRGVSDAEKRNRAHNERNKGLRANHNRRVGAERKRAKGMGMLSHR